MDNRTIVDPEEGRFRHAHFVNLQSVFIWLIILSKSATFITPSPLMAKLSGTT
jgi:hypothetical protein